MVWLYLIFLSPLVITAISFIYTCHQDRIKKQQQNDLSENLI